MDTFCTCIPTGYRGVLPHDCEPNAGIYLDAYFIDIYEVTAGQYKACVNAGACSFTAISDSSSIAQSPWRTYDNNRNNHPINYLKWDQARTYCEWLGKRLPTEIEWQFAGQGNRNGSDGEAQLFPWGEKDNATLRPTMTTGNIFRGPEPVDKYSPAGDSPFGLMSMIGNVWQMTDEYADGHTRSVILRGGSNYRPSGSGWYLPQTLRGDRSLATQLNEHDKCELRA